MKRAILGAAATVTVIVVGWIAFEDTAVPLENRRVVALATGVTLSLAVPAVVGAWRRPTDRAPVRLLVAALALAVGNFRLLAPSSAATVGAGVWYATPLLLVAVLLDPSHGRPPLPRFLTRVMPVILTAGLLLTSGPRTDRVLTPNLRSSSWSHYSERAGFRVYQGNPLARLPNNVSVWLLLVVWAVWVGAGSVLIVRRLGARSIFARVALAAAVAATLVLAWPQDLSPSDQTPLLNHWYADLLLGIPIAAAAGAGIVAVWGELVRPRLSRSVDGALQLGADATPEAQRRELVRTLADPTARLLFRDDASAWIDEKGQPAAIEVLPPRAVTIVRRDGRELAALEHDASLLGQPDLLEIAATSLALTLDARRLAAMAEAAAEDARASAARLLQAADAGRQQVEWRILTGPERRLEATAGLLSARPIDLAAVHDGLRAALAEVRDIAHGATPPSLEREGLAVALEDLRGTAEAALVLKDLPAVRFPVAIESTLYAAVHDALASAGGPVEAAFRADTDTVQLRMTGASVVLDPLTIDRVEALDGAVIVSEGAVAVTVPSGTD
jgi:hypothetical protein